MDLETLENVMRQYDGRRFVSDLLDLCGDGQHFTTGNGREDAFVSGRLSVGDEVLRHIRRIKSTNESEDGLALTYLMLRERQRRLEELEDGRQYDNDEY